MTAARSSGVVVDTMVISWLFRDRPPMADAYRSLIDGRSIILCFQTVMELRFGALSAGWGELRRRRLDHDIGQLSVVQADDELVTLCAQLRDRCVRAVTASVTRSTTATAGSRRPPSGSMCHWSVTTASSETSRDSS